MENFNLSERELGLAGNALRNHGRDLKVKCAEMRADAKYDGDLVICGILEEQADEEIALADKIDGM